MTTVESQIKSAFDYTLNVGLSFRNAGQAVSILLGWTGSPWQAPTYYTNSDDCLLTIFMGSVHQYVEEASTVECLTSKFKYVREYKRFMEQTAKENRDSAKSKE